MTETYHILGVICPRHEGPEAAPQTSCTHISVEDEKKKGKEKMQMTVQKLRITEQ